MQPVGYTPWYSMDAHFAVLVGSESFLHDTALNMNHMNIRCCSFGFIKRSLHHYTEIMALKTAIFKVD